MDGEKLTLPFTPMGREQIRAVAKRGGTVAAYDPATQRMIHFLDRVYDGDTVDVYRSIEDAEAERGAPRKMRVIWDDPDEWTLLPA